MFQSITRTRRRNARGVKVLVGVLLGGLVALGLYAFVLQDERIRHYDVQVAVQRDGSALVRETITYDFGAMDRHGIKRTFPGYRVVSTEGESGAAWREITVLDVASASAPDQDELLVDEIRVGDPDVEISGRHTYRIDYRLPGAVVDGRFAVDVIGTGWEVPIEEATVDVRLPFAPSGVRCKQGQEFSTASCASVTSSASTITVQAADLGEGEGVTVFADGGDAAKGSAKLPAAGPLPDGDPQWWLTAILLIVGVGAAGYVLGLIPVAWWARRVGRDHAYHGGGGAVDAVFGGPELPSKPIDGRLADEQVTIQFVPPPDLTPPQGGMVLAEKVTDDHRVAWLTQQALDGWIEITNGGKKLVWTGHAHHRASAPVALQRMFTGRQSVKLTKYNRDFAEGWKKIDSELEHWREHCGLWDVTAEQRSRRVESRISLVGFLAALGGVVGLIILPPVNLLAAVIVAGVAGLLVGAGVSASVNADELHVRTPAGFAQRQLAAGFLRFFQQSEARHAQEAADRGELRLYSAWAVAFGVVDAWQDAMSAAALPPDTPGYADIGSYAAMSAAVHTANTQPPSTSSGGGGSSSGYSGGGGGSVGGGSGGGGGGSW